MLGACVLQAETRVFYSYHELVAENFGFVLTSQTAPAAITCCVFVLGITKRRDQSEKEPLH
eukprot:5497300-Amphidinium_carterae.2